MAKQWSAWSCGFKVTCSSSWRSEKDTKWKTKLVRLLFQDSQLRGRRDGPSGSGAWKKSSPLRALWIRGVRLPLLQSQVSPGRQLVHAFWWQHGPQYSGHGVRKLWGQQNYQEVNRFISSLYLSCFDTRFLLFVLQGVWLIHVYQWLDRLTVTQLSLPLMIKSGS